MNSDVAATSLEMKIAKVSAPVLTIHGNKDRNAPYGGEENGPVSSCTQRRPLLQTTQERIDDSGVPALIESQINELDRMRISKGESAEKIQSHCFEFLAEELKRKTRAQENNDDEFFD